MIKRFIEVDGRMLFPIAGQQRVAYTLSGSTDFYELKERAAHGGHPGTVIKFYDYRRRRVVQPFEQKPNVMYSAPIFSWNHYFFLQCDYGEKVLRLYRYIPERPLVLFEDLDLTGFDLYNLRLVGDAPHIISQNGEWFRCYWPEKFSFPLQPNETVCFIEDDKVYLEAWFEEGWDDEHDCAGPDYKFYDKVIVKDFEGNTLSEEVGSLNQGPDGDWWIS